MITTHDSSAAPARKQAYTTRELVLDAMFIALTLVFTAFVNIRLPIAANGGLIHLGNVPLFLCAILFGKRTGTLAGAFGMGLFDLLSGWTLWAPFTFVIVGLMGFVVGTITERHHGFGWNSLALAAACLIKIVGYYFAEVIIYHSWTAPVASIPGNLIQIGVAAVIVLATAEHLRKLLRNF
ncbi:MAG: ECF transporter S component [Lachnospiraceae bacterium]|nr:ECF transporter S component [Lachnospiraceae bacterium]